ncbi:hypothetical protein ABZ543_08250 [Streptomyces roseifaciens]
MTANNDNPTPRVYKPSKKLQALIKAHEKAVEAADKALVALEKGVAEELTNDLELTNREVGVPLKWHEEKVRRISRKYNVPRRRARTDDDRAARETRKAAEEGDQPTPAPAPAE